MRYIVTMTYDNSELLFNVKIFADDRWDAITKAFKLFPNALLVRCEKA